MVCFYTKKIYEIDYSILTNRLSENNKADYLQIGHKDNDRDATKISYRISNDN